VKPNLEIEAMDSPLASTQPPSSLEPIRHADTPWAVASMIEPAPGAMMMRELVKNALEAAARTASASSRGQVVFDACEVRGASGPIAKLRIKNSGPGMDAAELRAVMDLHASGGGKVNGINDNFGVGAKVTGLKNNPAGMRYRSCKNGRVSEAFLCKAAGDYGLLKQPDGTGGYTAIIDRTDALAAEGVDLKMDWTEVVLFGEDLEHDTTTEPLKKGRPASSNWIAAAVNNRFYELPSNVDVEIDVSLDRGKHPQRRILRGAATTVKGSAAKGQHALVSLGNGVEVEFAVLGKEGQNRYALTGQSGIVFRGEIYDFTSGANEWARRAARFGITYGAAQVVVFVHLPDSAKLTPDKYRQRLEKDEPDRPEATADDYAALVAKHLPDFVRKHIEASKPKSLEDSKSLQDRLKRLAVEYDWRRGVFKHDAAGTDLGGGLTTRGEGKGGKRGGGGTGTRTNTPGGNRSSPSGGPKRGVLPKIDWIDGGVRRSDGELAGRAASYDPKIHALRLNLNYEGLDAAVKALVARWPNAVDTQALQHEAMLACQEEYTVRACKAVMHAFMHESDRAWTRESIVSALSDYALTIHLDDVKEVAERAVAHLRKKWGAPV
jgi:hypothetical protein